MIYPELKGKVAIVTGAGRNIGRAIALALAKSGAIVVICDVDDTAAAETCALAGPSSSVCIMNVAEAEDWSRAVGETVRRHGRIDILVNNAGVTQTNRPFLAEVDSGLFDRIIDINLKGTWLGIKHVVPRMIDQGSGCIVNMSSIMGLVAKPGIGIYAASKHGVLALTKAAALEYGIKGVRVNAVCPGRQSGAMIASSPGEMDRKSWLKDTHAMSPASGRAGTGEDVSAAILFLCSNGSANIHGVALPIDGGYLQA